MEFFGYEALVSTFGQMIRNPKSNWSNEMQTDIEILETRENPSVLWL